jgi:hypothetical protein
MTNGLRYSNPRLVTPVQKDAHELSNPRSKDLL